MSPTITVMLGDTRVQLFLVAHEDVRMPLEPEPEWNPRDLARKEIEESLMEAVVWWRINGFRGRNSGLTGMDAMRLWNKTWEMHHLPRWFKKALRQSALWRERDRGRAPLGSRCEEGYYLPNLIFDHYGSFVPDGDATASKDSRHVASMPYGRHDECAREFAGELDCHVKCFPVGPWAPGSCLYIFSEK